MDDMDSGMQENSNIQDQNSNVEVSLVSWLDLTHSHVCSADSFLRLGVLSDSNESMPSVVAA